MDPITVVTIPISYVNFAKDVTKLAKQHGIKSCAIKITPDWRDQGAQSIHGDVQINYSAKDGRGRPCDNLDVYLNAHTQLKVVENEPSSN